MKCVVGTISVILVLSYAYITRISGSEINNNILYKISNVIFFTNVSRKIESNDKENEMRGWNNVSRFRFLS